jgi:CTP synthase (UTP-ammonia lyase)
VEYARNVLGIRNAHLGEYEPTEATLLITPVACAVVTRPTGAPKLSGRLRVALQPGSLAHRIYGLSAIEEEYFCNYELNPAFRAPLEAAGLRVSGEGERGEARVVELPTSRFFLATLFLPQLASSAWSPHPVITAYLRAARAHRHERESISRSSS